MTFRTQIRFPNDSREKIPVSFHLGLVLGLAGFESKAIVLNVVLRMNESVSVHFVCTFEIIRWKVNASIHSYMFR